MNFEISILWCTEMMMKKHNKVDWNARWQKSTKKNLFTIAKQKIKSKDQKTSTQYAIKQNISFRLTYLKYWQQGLQRLPFGVLYNWDETEQLAQAPLPEDSVFCHERTKVK